MTQTVRDHFVYRAFDVDGQVLYIGCTQNLKQRWRSHHYERPAVVLAAVRCKIQGPFTKSKALAIEAAAIRSENPPFNRGLSRHEQLRRNVIASYHLGIRTHIPYPCPARDILVEAGLIEVAS